MGRRQRSVEITGKDNVVGSSSGNVDSLPKRKKNHQKDELEDNSDRFGELPDCLLVEILSLLPMKDAVKTGVLCKRWKILWTLVDRIRFSEAYTGFEKIERFISFVDNTLFQCACPNLKEFSLCMLEDDYFELSTPAIEKWLQYVSNKNVEFLEIDINVCRFPLLGQFSWFSLEKLSLKDVSVDDKGIADILLGCPLLDTLILNELTDVKHLNIASPKLRKLKVLSFYGDGFLEINAPWLQELEISGDFDGFECRLVDVSSLVFAKVTFIYYTLGCMGCYDNNEKRFALNMATKILKKLHHVEELIVGPLLIQALSVLELLGKSSPLFKCKKLTIGSLLLDFELPGIVCLLQRSPHLETLVIQLQEVHPRELEYVTDTCKVSGKEFLSMQKGNFPHLKNIKVLDGRNFLCQLYSFCYSKYRDCKCYNFELVAYLLKNACALQKLVISSTGDDICECSSSCALHHLSSLSHKLLYILLNGNEAAQWAFTKNQFDFEFTFSGPHSCK